MATAQTILNDLNGVSFGQTGQLVSDYSQGYGYNSVGYSADVNASLTSTSANSGYVQVGLCDQVAQQSQCRLLHPG
jgi:hypothetical protein